MEDDSLPLSRTAAVTKTSLVSDMENDSRTSLKQEMGKGFFFPGTTEVLMEKESRPIYRNPCVAAPSKPRCTSTDEDYGGVSLALLSGRAVTEGMIRMAKYIMYHSLVVVAVHQGDEILALLPGTIIRSDGVVATCANGLIFCTIKELRVTVKVLGERVTHEGALLDAPFSLKFAFIKFKSPGQQKVPTFAKGFGMRGVAVGCISQGPELRDIGFIYLPALICGVVNENENKQSHAMTSGRVVQAFPEGCGNFIGCPLVEPWGGLIGVVRYQYGSELKATPMDEVLKCLEHLENSSPFQLHDIKVVEEEGCLAGKLDSPTTTKSGYSSPFQLHDIKVVEEEGYLAGKLDSPTTTITTTKGSNRLPRITTANPPLLLLLFLCFFLFCRLLSFLFTFICFGKIEEIGSL